MPGAQPPEPLPCQQVRRQLPDLRGLAALLSSYSLSRPTAGLTWQLMLSPSQPTLLMHPMLHAVHILMSLVRPSYDFFGSSGSAKSARPIATKSALPFSRISSASTGLLILPTAITGLVTAALMPGEVRQATSGGRHRLLAPMLGFVNCRGDIECVNADLLKSRANDLGFIKFQALRDHLVCADSEDYWEIGTNFLSSSLDDLNRKSQSLLQASAVKISPLVSVR